MNIPMHLVCDLQFDAPHFTLGGQALDPALRPQRAVEFASPIAGPVSGDDLQCFAQLMAQERIALQPTRMLYDRLYAFERLALAHAGASPALREMAMRLFNGYQKAGEWIGLIH